jgi:hypothetical protein
LPPVIKTTSQSPTTATEPAHGTTQRESMKCPHCEGTVFKLVRIIAFKRTQAPRINDSS